MQNTKIAQPLNSSIGKHTFYVYGKVKDCWFHQWVNVGFPTVAQLSTCKGSTIEQKVDDWLGRNWYTNVPIMRAIVEFLRENNTGTTKSHKVFSSQDRKAAEAIIAFIEKNVETLAQIGSGFDFEKGFNPFVPRISDEVRAMSFAERQKLLRDNNKARLEENI